MNSHAHVILELHAPTEVSLSWDLNLSASFSSQDFSRYPKSRERQSATNTPSYRWESEWERERERRFDDLNTLPCRVRVVLNLFQVPMVRGLNSECVRRHVTSTWEQAHRSLARAQPHRPLMNSHAHVILELHAPKEVSLSWDLNLSASFSSQDFSRFTKSRARQSATNTPSYRWESERASEREREGRFEDLNTLPCRVRVVFNLFEREREKIEEDLNSLPCRVRVVFSLFES